MLNTQNLKFSDEQPVSRPANPLNENTIGNKISLTESTIGVTKDSKK
jgi:hypothetical protein